MKLESITVENYRQFEKAELTFDEGITILAGANNSGKTSLINLIKNIFVDDKLNYNMSDIPAKNMREWVEWVYPIFQKFFRDRKTEENVEKDLLNVVIPKEETDSTHLMKMTTVKIHVSYNPDMDDIKLFADCIMDLDETKHDFYFMYNFEIVHTQFAREIINNFSKIKHRFAEIEEKKSQYAETTDELIINNIQVKERYLKQLIVSLYIQATIPNVYFCDEDYKNKCKFDETKKFRQLFNFCFIKASRPLDDDESDHSHMLSKQMIKMVKMDEKWNELVESLPDEVLKPIQEKEIDKAIRSTSLESLKDTIATLEQTNGGKSGELMLDMQISEEDISDLLQRITTATYTEQKETWTEGAERYKEKYGSLDLDTVRSNINKISYNETPFNSLLYGGLGHNDLITFTKLAVDRFPIIKKKISDKYQLIFIDEYQDTSAEVLHIFYTSLVGKKSKLYLLGDKMQQIYKNYNGEFEEKLETFNRSVNLSINYRTTPKIVDILNYIYNDEALKQCPYEKNSNDTMAFSPKVLIVSDVEKAISDFRKTYEDALLLYVSNRARFYDIGAGNLYDAYYKNINMAAEDKTPYGSN